MKRALVSSAVAAIPSLFLAGISLNLAPGVLVSFEGALCDDGERLETGSRAVPGSRSGSEGVARCVDAACNVDDTAFFRAFLAVFATSTVVLGAVLVRSTAVRARWRASRWPCCRAGLAG